MTPMEKALKKAQEMTLESPALETSPMEEALRNSQKNSSTKKPPPTSPTQRSPSGQRGSPTKNRKSKTRVFESLEDPRSEEVVLASIFQSAQEYERIKPSAAVFTGDRRRIAAAVCAMRSRGQHVTVAGVAAASGCEDEIVKRRTSGKLEGGSVSEIYDRLQELAERRRTADLCREFHERAYSKKPFNGGAGELASQLLDTVAEGGSVERSPSTIDVLEDLEYRAENPGVPMGVTGIGFDQFFATIDGFLPGQFITLGARTSVGKTSLILDLVRGLCLAGETPGYFGLEMNPKRIKERLVAKEAGLSLKSAISGLTPTAANKIAAGIEAVNKWDWFLAVRPMKLAQLETEIRKAARSGMRVAFVDYVQIVRIPGMDNRRAEVSEVCSTLKGLAEDLGITVFQAAQLKRGQPYFDSASKRTVTPAPTLESLKESGSLEEDSDVVGLLTRNYLDIAKNRDGETKKIDLEFNKDTMSFAENKNNPEF